MKKYNSLHQALVVMLVYFAPTLGMDQSSIGFGSSKPENQLAQSGMNFAIKPLGQSFTNPDDYLDEKLTNNKNKLLTYLDSLKRNNKNEHLKLNLTKTINDFEILIQKTDSSINPDNSKRLADLEEIKQIINNNKVFKAADINTWKKTIANTYHVTIDRYNDILQGQSPLESSTLQLQNLQKEETNNTTWPDTPQEQIAYINDKDWDINTKTFILQLLWLNEYKEENKGSRIPFANELREMGQPIPSIAHAKGKTQTPKLILNPIDFITSFDFKNVDTILAAFIKKNVRPLIRPIYLASKKVFYNKIKDEAYSPILQDYKNYLKVLNAYDLCISPEDNELKETITQEIEKVKTFYSKRKKLEVTKQKKLEIEKTKIINQMLKDIAQKKANQMTLEFLKKEEQFILEQAKLAEQEILATQQQRLIEEAKEQRELEKESNTFKQILISGAIDEQEIKNQLKNNDRITENDKKEIEEYLFKDIKQEDERKKLIEAQRTERINQTLEEERLAAQQKQNNNVPEETLSNKIQHIVLKLYRMNVIRMSNEQRKEAITDILFLANNLKDSNESDKQLINLLLNKSTLFNPASYPLLANLIEDEKKDQFKKAWDTIKNLSITQEIAKESTITTSTQPQTEVIPEQQKLATQQVKQPIITTIPTQSITTIITTQQKKEMQKHIDQKRIETEQPTKNIPKQEPEEDVQRWIPKWITSRLTALQQTVGNFFSYLRSWWPF
jgi:hypothetical protein